MFLTILLRKLKNIEEKQNIIHHIYKISQSITVRKNKSYT